MAYLYMVKLSRPLGTSQHQASLYLGSCIDINQRMREHNSGRGAKMLKVAGEQGIPYHLCRLLEVPTSQDARRLEAKYKRWKNNARVMNCRKLWQPQ
ncbi:MAG: GIY-YIG nuclease family protein [Oculatellaceae cyanobacterium bins.114]|nr:GIY-YIG nuclease family protein [Oculatellaceae cyanobacterium bins.114]